MTELSYMDCWTLAQPILYKGLDDNEIDRAVYVKLYMAIKQAQELEDIKAESKKLDRKLRKQTNKPCTNHN